MSAFAVAAFHQPALPAGARRVEAIVWIRAAGLGSHGADVALSLWTPVRAEIAALRQVTPASADRLADCVRVDERTLRLDAGRWLDGVHEFELEVALPAGSPGDELLATRIGVLADGERVAGALVTVTWTVVVGGDELPPTGEEPEPGGTAAVGSADLPTGPSPEHRHTGTAESGAAAPCAGCGELPDDGDRYCEGCGRELAAG